MPPASIRTFSSLLASPPGVRAAIARNLFGGGNAGVTRTTRSLATIGGARENGNVVVLFCFPLTTPSPPPRVLCAQRSWAVQKRFRSVSPEAASSEATPPPPPPPPLPPASEDSATASGGVSAGRSSRVWAFIATTGLAFVFFSVGFVMAAAPVAQAANGLLNAPSDAQTLDLYYPATPSAAQINEYIANHPLSQRLRAQEGMVESRPHMKIPPAMRAHNLTGGTLLGEGKIEVPPLTFSEKEAALPTLTQISYLGPALCGHPDIVHGGLLATLLDEGLARACFPALPNKVGVTASLKIDYRKPCPGSSYVVLKAETTKVEGRKAWVKGWIELLGEEDAEGTVLVEAEALFIEPKGASSLARVAGGT